MADEDRRADVAALEAEVERLRRRNAALESPGGARARRLARSIAVVVLVVVGALCLTLTVPAVWARNQVLDTERYVANTAPLATDPGVQAAVEAVANRQIAARLDVGGLVAQALPQQAQRLRAPIASAVTGLVAAAVHRAVVSEQFAAVWTAANRAAHATLVGILTGEDEGRAVTVAGGAVLLDLAPVIELVKTRLVASGLTVAQSIPAVGTSIEIARLDGVERAQQLVRWLRTLADWLPWIGLAAIAGAVALAPGRRRRTVLRAALATALGLLLLRAGLLVARELYLDRMPTTVLSTSASAAVFDTLTRFLRDGIRLAFVVVLLVAGLAALLGHRATVARLGGRALTVGRGLWHDLSRGPLGVAVTRRPRAAAGSVAALGALVLVLWDDPTGTIVLTVLVVVALVLAAGAALVARRPRTTGGEDVEVAPPAPSQG